MDAITADLLLTVVASISLVGLGVASVAVLPWSQRDLRTSVTAWRTLGALGARSVHALVAWGQLAPRPVPIPVRADPVTLVPDCR